ncbi:MAG TPA: DUF4404 family protein [Pirellulales bacterium]|nr:DUF4404 family protein [Pirellulales bacterium]
MTQGPEELRARLADLHRQLQATRSVSGDVRTLLVELLGDIDRLLVDASQPAAAIEQDRGKPEIGEQSGIGQPGTELPGTGLGQRLADAAQQFEETHPQLAANLGSVVTALSRLGI